MIEAKKLTKYYASGENRFQVLKNISLQIQNGDYVVILGASGSGKSTLLNVISGLERPESGEIRYDNEDITTFSDNRLTEFRRKNIAFIFQQYYLLPHMDVARALAKNPKVLFLDEPTGALDEQTGRQVLDYISRLQTEYGFTIVMVTHNLNIAEMANTVIRMNSGRISEIYTNDTQKTAYEIGW